MSTSNKVAGSIVPKKVKKNGISQINKLVSSNYIITNLF